MPLLLPLLLCCDSGKVRLEDLHEAADIVDACERSEPEKVSLEILFPAQTGTCPWGEGDNSDAQGGVFTARLEETERLELPEQAVICDMTLDFSGLVPGEVQVMAYDDHFFLTFNDIVLAASYGPAVDRLAEEEEGLPVYAWGSIAGMDYHEEADFDAWCLGDGTGESTCDIPDTEVEGPISLTYSQALVSELSLMAIEDERVDFGFVTTGDNDPESDCQHDAFGFTIEIPYLTP